MIGAGKESQSQERQRCDHWDICYFRHGQIGRCIEHDAMGCSFASHSSAPQQSAEQVLDQIENTVSERIAELKSWIKLAKINQDRNRELEILPILGENQALWAQIKELHQQQEREQG